MFNARLLFARHNLYPQESVSREAARKEAQIASSCDECRKVGAVRAREYRGGDLLRRDGVLFELTLEGGLTLGAHDPGQETREERMQGENAL